MTDQNDFFENMNGPTEAGGMIVMMNQDAKSSASIKMLEKSAGVKVASSRDFSASSENIGEDVGHEGTMFLDKLKIAVISDADPERISTLSSTLNSDANVTVIRPEYMMYPSEQLSADYVAWLEEGARLLLGGNQNGANDVESLRFASPIRSTANATWGIRAIRADQTGLTGRGIKIAVLDTGFDFPHPDFVGRTITRQSFVPGETAQDSVGHGTHCIGTAAGPDASGGRPRYGVATQADIFVGKVLGQNGGRERWVLAGIEQAIRRECEVISMSLGRRVRVGEPYDQVYERAGQIALANDSLIIAAAGNDSNRPGQTAPVNAPANAPSIMAIGAIDSSGRMARFSNGDRNGDGGEVNLVGPGVGVVSSYPMPRRYADLQGTSMATPHVAGAAAQFAESHPSLRGVELWAALQSNARNIGLPLEDGGAGLVQSPKGPSAVGMV